MAFSAMEANIMDADYRSRSFFFHALNLVGYNKICHRYLAREIPPVARAVLSLKVLTEEFKTRTDLNGLECDSSPMFRFLKTVLDRLLFENEAENVLVFLKYLYFKKKLLCILRKNVFADYIQFIQTRLESCSGTEEAETLIRKFLRVYHLSPLKLELSGDEVGQYEFMASLLEFCFFINIQDSQLVTDLLKATIDWYVIDTTDIRHVRQDFYSQGFFEFILKHATATKFDIESYCRCNPRSLWLYSRKFSLLNAVAFGNIPRTLALLQHGFPVFTEVDIQRSGHGCPHLEEILPTTHLMVLQMMCSMRSVNLFILNSTNSMERGLYSATKDQMECFRLIWRAIPSPYVRHADVVTSVFNEYFALTRSLVFNSNRYERNSKFCVMYETCFPDMAHGPKEPRSLQHLCRCTIRKRLRENWALPSGIYQLRLPKTIKDYLNLERECVLGN